MWTARSARWSRTATWSRGFWERAQGRTAEEETAVPVLTVVHAPHLVYTETNRLAVYTGGVTWTRPGMHVKSRDIARVPGRIGRRFAAGEGLRRWRGGDCPDGRRTASRTGTAEHSEYYTADQKVILTGGPPKMVDNARQYPKGREIDLLRQR